LKLKSQLSDLVIKSHSDANFFTCSSRHQADRHRALQEFLSVKPQTVLVAALAARAVEAHDDTRQHVQLVTSRPIVEGGTERAMVPGRRPNGQRRHPFAAREGDWGSQRSCGSGEAIRASTVPKHFTSIQHF
jgi:hypothetical protein